MSETKGTVKRLDREVLEPQMRLLEALRRSSPEDLRSQVIADYRLADLAEWLTRSNPLPHRLTAAELLQLPVDPDRAELRGAKLWRSWVGIDRCWWLHREQPLGLSGATQTDSARVEVVAVEPTPAPSFYRLAVHYAEGDQHTAIFTDEAEAHREWRSSRRGPGVVVEARLDEVYEGAIPHAGERCHWTRAGAVGGAGRGIGGGVDRASFWDPTPYHREKVEAIVASLAAQAPKGVTIAIVDAKDPLAKGWLVTFAAEGIRAVELVGMTNDADAIEGGWKEFLVRAGAHG